MKKNIRDLLRGNPVIPGIKDDRGLQSVLSAENKLVFILYGTIVNIGEIVGSLKDAGKTVFVNVDLLEGGGGRGIILDFLRQNSDTDGILSSKAGLVKAAKNLGFYTIHRFFLIYSFSFKSMDKQIKMSEPDCLEILPGWPKLVSWTLDKLDYPLIAGGLICFEEDMKAALDAGANSISTTNENLWPGKGRSRPKNR